MWGRSVRKGPFVARSRANDSVVLVASSLFYEVHTQMSLTLTSDMWPVSSHPVPLITHPLSGQQGKAHTFLCFASHLNATQTTLKICCKNMLHLITQCVTRRESLALCLQPCHSLTFGNILKSSVRITLIPVCTTAALPREGLASL